MGATTDSYGLGGKLGKISNWSTNGREGVFKVELK
jgi:hypothetical protein